jgi:hypothetical protein
MDYKTSILVTIRNSSNFDETNKKVLVPHSVIKGVQQITERNYSKPKEGDNYPLENVTVILLDKKFALENELCLTPDYKSYFFGDSSPIAVKIQHDFNVFVGLLKGDKAAEVLFNE